MNFDWISMAKVLHNTSIFQSVGRSIVMNVNLYVYAFRVMDINNESKRVQRYVEQWVSFVSLTFSCLNICINFPFLVYITHGFISFWHLYNLLMVLRRKYYISRKEYLIFLYHLSSSFNSIPRWKYQRRW